MTILRRFTAIIRFLGVFGFLVFAFISGCATAEEADTEAPAGSVAERPTAMGGGPEPIKQSYDLESLLEPLISYQMITRSVDYFYQFTWGDEIFVDYLYYAFALDNTPYLLGEGIVLSSSGGAAGQTLVSLAVVGEEGAARWMQISAEYGGGEFYIEALVDQTGVPMKVRYMHPESGASHERIPMWANELNRALSESDRKTVAPKIRDYVIERTKSARNGMFANPEIRGEETIEVPAGSFQAVHVTDTYDDQMVDYWLSPDVPGGIIKMTAPGPDGEFTIELTARIFDARRRIPDEDLVPEVTDDGAFFDDEEYTVYESEGGATDPLILVAGEFHSGTVGSGERSFYGVYVPKRSDIEIMVSEVQGRAELYYYGTDSLFENWITSASGGATLDVQDYFIEPGTWIYFAVEDIFDENLPGQSYFIEIIPTYELDSIGILISGEIYELAQELATGQNSTVQISEDNLLYLKAKMRGNGTLKITAKLPGDLSLKWFDTQGGSYSSGSEYRDADSSGLEVMGLSEDTVCYFYIVGEPGSGAGVRDISLQIEER